MDDAEIDEFASDIERRIQKGREFIDSLPEFEEGKRKRRANTVVNTQEILTGDAGRHPGTGDED